MVMYWLPMKGAFLCDVLRYSVVQPLHLHGHREAQGADSYRIKTTFAFFGQTLLLRRIRFCPQKGETPNFGVFSVPTAEHRIRRCREMAKAGARIKITLRCSECKQRNYNTNKNKKNTPDRLELNKFCPFCRKHTVHNETK